MMHSSNMLITNVTLQGKEGLYQILIHDGKFTFEGIERWAERKALLSIEDVKSRAKQTLKWQIANGIQHVRTHVDVSDPTLTALKAMIEVREEMRPWVDIQIVAFPQEGILSYPNGKELLEQAVFEFTREYGIESLHYVFELARKYNRLIDVHCDEIDDEQSRFVETVAALAHKYEMGHKVTANQACCQPTSEYSSTRSL